jgi:polysaccharide biosynthesis/export protein
MRFSALFFCLFVALGAPAGTADYEIGPEDVLHVIVLGQTEMTGDYPVDREGMMNFPFLGKIKATGLSPVDLERKLTTLLSDGYLKRPQVSLTVKEYRSQRVFVTGEVVKPGPYALKGDRSLRALFGDVGALTADASREVVVIRPPDGGLEAQPLDVPTENESPSDLPGPEIFRVNLRELRSGSPEKNLILKPGDTVHVPKRPQIYITGHVARQGPYRFESDTTVLQALTVAGGVTERGSAKGVKIIRIVNGEKVEFKAKPTDVVLPGDTVVVPERFF